jgi:hypothetical protein
LVANLNNNRLQRKAKFYFSGFSRKTVVADGFSFVEEFVYLLEPCRTNSQEWAKNRGEVWAFGRILFYGRQAGLLADAVILSKFS